MSLHALTELRFEVSLCNPRRQQKASYSLPPWIPGKLVIATPCCCLSKMSFFVSVPLYLFYSCFLKCECNHVRYSWRHQLCEFSCQYHTVALDLRGCGDSDAPSQLDEYTLEKLLYDIRDTIDELGMSMFGMDALLATIK